MGESGIITPAQDTGVRSVFGRTGIVAAAPGDYTVSQVTSALAPVATTGTAGYTLANGTGNIITWTAPNDGQLHRAIILATLSVSILEVGGLIVASYSDPAGASHQPQVFAAALGVGVTSFITQYFVQAGTTVTVQQSTALTVGAAVLWAEIWGS